MKVSVVTLMALVLLLVAIVIGMASFAAFLLFLYTGSLDWVDLRFSETQSLVFNALLSFAFFLQHSGMVRKSFRHHLTSIIPVHYLGVTYTIVSALFLLLAAILWQGSGNIIYDVEGVYELLIRTVFFTSILGMCWGMWALRSIDMFGLEPVIKKIGTRPSQSIPFTINGPYRWVRHPLYLFMIILFWSTPVLTTDRLLFNILWTAWVVIGTMLEERDLADDFGESYKEYQATVPMLLPRCIRAIYPLKAINKQTGRRD